MPKAKSSSASKVPSAIKDAPQPASKSLRSKSASTKNAKDTKHVAPPIKKGSKVIKKDAKKSSTPSNSQSSSGSSVHKSKNKSASKSKNADKSSDKALALLSQKDKKSKSPQKDKGIKPPQSSFDMFSAKIWAMYEDDQKFQSCSKNEKREIVRKSWQKLTKEKKQKYEQKAQNDKERYDKECRAQKRKRVSVSSKSMSQSSEEQNSDEPPRKAAKKSPEKSPGTQTNMKKVKGIINSYNAFSRLVTPRLREENPDITFGELQSKISAEWKGGEGATKKQEAEMDKLIKDDLKRYKEELEKAKANATISQAKAQSKSKSPSPAKEQKPLQVMPKPATTSFFAFINKNRERIKEENKDAAVTEIAKLAGEEWKAMTESDKEEYVAIVEQDRKRLAKEMEQLKSKGYFINSDGVKSTDLKPKTPKGSNSSTQKSFREEGEARVPKGLTNYTVGTLLPKNIKSPFFYFSAQAWVDVKEKRVGDEKFDYIKITKENAERWKGLTEEEKQQYQDLYEGDKKRRDDEFDQIRKKGYFTTEDGVKSTDLPVKKPKVKLGPRSPKKTNADESQD